MSEFELQAATEALMESLGLDVEDDDVFLTIADALQEAYDAGQDDLGEELEALADGQ